MKLLNRYVAAVTRYLPPAARDDVGNELLSLLEARVDAEAERLGRDPTDDEIGQILLQHGNPQKVAASYRVNRPLVSASAFPLYVKIMTGTASQWFMFVIFLGLYDIFYREGPWAVFAVPEFWHMVVDVLLALFFLVTMFFFVFGEVLDKTGFGWRWDPKRLPLKQSAWIAVSLRQLIINTVIVMSFLGLIVSNVYAYSAPQASVAIGEGAVRLVPAMQVICLLALFLNALNLLQRHWTRAKLYASALLAVAMAGLLSWIVLFHRVLLLAETGTASTNWGNTFLTYWPEIVLKALLIIAVGLLLRSAWKDWRQAQTPALPAI